MSAASEPPPSEKIPGTSGGGAPYVLGILVLGALAGGLVCWKSKQSSPTTTAQSASTLQVASAPPQPQLPQFAPPPPPKLDEEIDAGPAPSTKATGQSAAPAGAGPCGKCTDGQTSPALNTALRSRVQSTQSCYNRALQHNSEVAGSMTVSVQVGFTGTVCGASIVNDSVHSAEVSSCVLGRIRGQSFPPPTSGCVTLNIPIAFATKQ